MSGGPEDFPAVTRAVFGMLAAAMALAVVRLARGPTLFDRVIALDFMATVAIGGTAAYAVATGQAVLLSPAVALALLAFLGTVAIARYAGQRGDR